VRTRGMIDCIIAERNMPYILIRGAVTLPFS
jgi:hypothetical protein